MPLAELAVLQPRLGGGECAVPELEDDLDLSVPRAEHAGTAGVKVAALEA
jgi:hypothetical protein